MRRATILWALVVSIAWGIPAVARPNTAAIGARHSVVVDGAGRVIVWGDNSRAQLGLGHERPVLVPTPIPGLADAVAVAAGAVHTLVLEKDGTVWAFGGNDDGQLGDGSQDGSAVPARVVGLDGVSAIAAGESHSVAWKLDGSAWVWGAVGDGKHVLVPTQVKGLPPVLAIAAGDHRSLAVSFDRTVWMWSHGSADLDAAPAQANGIRNASEVAIGDRFNLVLDSSGALWSWGPPDTPARLDLAGTTVIGVGRDHALAANSEGLWTWGRGLEGQLGHGAQEPHGKPSRPQEPSGISVIASGPGHHSLVVTADAEVWAWGANDAAQVGDGTNETRTTPVQLAERGFAWKAARPVLTPAPGTYHEPLRVTVSSATTDAQIRYTTDGSSPTEESALLPPGTAIPVERSLELRLRAWRKGLRSSSTTTAAYVLQALAPVLNPAGGKFKGTSVAITMAAPSAGVVIRYTTDGTDPDENAPLYGGTLVISKSTLVKARSFRRGWTSSDITVARYALPDEGDRDPRLMAQVATPTLVPGTGTYNTTQTVTVSCATAGATIHYTTNGATPTESDPVIASGNTLSVAATQTLKAAAWLTGWTPSAVASATYTMVVGTPTFSLAGGNYTGAQTVTLNTATSGATINYTTNGLDPAPSDPSVAPGGTVVVGASATLRAKATKSGWTTSATAAVSYAINLGTAATPAFSPPGGSYATSQSVTMTTATSGAVIRYTVDGTDPGLSSPVYTGPVAVPVTTTLKARAFARDYAGSAVGSATYNLDGSAAATPSVTPGGGTYGSRVTVTITTSTSGATIRYTTNGIDPTASDTALSGSTLLIDHALRLKVRTFKSGLADSKVRTADYWITGAIAAGQNHTLAVKADGTAWGFGINSAGQLGDNSTTGRLTPVQVQGGLTDVIAVAGGLSHSLALKADGRVYSWGSNSYGQLGDNTYNPHLTPVQVPSLTNVVAIAAGTNHSLALKADGSVWAWGSNGSGRLGDGTTTTRPAPVPVLRVSGATAIAAGSDFSMALRTDGTTSGTAWIWGANAAAQFGDGSTNGSTIPVSGLGGVTRIAAGEGQALAVKTDGTAWGWGSGIGGALGDGAPAGNGAVNQRLVPVRVVGLTQVGALSTGTSSSVTSAHGLGLKTTGAVWASGANSRGQLGDGTFNARLYPGAVVTLTNILAIAGGAYHSVALGADGKLWTWGDGYYGQLGDGTSNTMREWPYAVAGFQSADSSWLLADGDGDGLKNRDELASGCDPTVRDSNGDGLLDGAAVASGLSCSNPDMDADGVANTLEATRGTDPFRSDTDGDGTGDATDCFPLDATRWQCPAPVPGDTTPPTITLTEPTNAVLVGSTPPL